jgi:hypothetical protein
LEHNGGDDVSVVEPIYENVLNRVPRDAEVDTLDALLQAGVPLSSVASDFVFSREDVTDLIQADFSTFLGYTAPSSVVPLFLDVESGSNDPESLLNDDILSSPESYMDRTEGMP